MDGAARQVEGSHLHVMSCHVMSYHIYIYIYIYVYICLSLSIYIYMSVCMYVYIYIYVGVVCEAEFLKAAPRA